jgi:hypothetical protein
VTRLAGKVTLDLPGGRAGVPSAYRQPASKCQHVFSRSNDEDFSGAIGACGVYIVCLGAGDIMNTMFAAQTVRLVCVVAAGLAHLIRQSDGFELLDGVLD